MTSVIYLQDTLELPEVDQLLERLQNSLLDSLHLDFQEADVEEAQAVARLAKGLRRIAQIKPLQIDYAPGLLAHNLYRLGALQQGKLTLFEPKDELAQSS